MKYSDPDLISLRRKRLQWLWRGRDKTRTVAKAIEGINKHETFNAEVGSSGFFFHGLHYRGDSPVQSNRATYSDSSIRETTRTRLNAHANDAVSQFTFFKTKCPFCGKEIDTKYSVEMTMELSVKSFATCSCKDAFGINRVIAGGLYSVRSIGENVSCFVSLGDTTSRDGKTVVFRGMKDTLTLPAHVIKALNIMHGYDTVNPRRYKKQELEKDCVLLDINKDDMAAFINGKSVVDDEYTMQRVAILKLASGEQLKIRVVPDTKAYMRRNSLLINLALNKDGVQLGMTRSPFASPDMFSLHTFLSVPCAIENTGTEAFVFFNFIPANFIEGYKDAVKRNTKHKKLST